MIARRALLLLAGLGAGCAADPPGELIGAYRVTLHLEEESCGPLARPFEDGRRYDVELRADGSRAFWRVLGIGPIDGRYRDGTFMFTFAMARELGDPDAGTAGCRVLRQELLQVEVAHVPDAGSADAAAAEVDAARADADAGPALRGEHTVSFFADPSGRCRDAQGPLGPFERLPCSARYRVEGSARTPFE